MIEIRTIKEIADLTPDQQSRFVQDLSAWLVWVNAHKDLVKDLPEGFRLDMPYDVIRWVDDDRPGECSGVTINVKIDRSPAAMKDGG